MSLFKRIFGKGKKESDKQIEQEGEPMELSFGKKTEKKEEPIASEKPKEEEMQPVVSEKPKEEEMQPVAPEKPKEEVQPIASEKSKKEEIQPTRSEKPKEKKKVEVKSIENAKVYPILKPGNWVGIKEGAIKQTILGSKENPQLVIGFGYDVPSDFVFLMAKDIEGKDPNEILGKAYDNLDGEASDFEVLKKLGGKVLKASGNDFSAEKILSESYMMKAHKFLRSTEVYVSIPRRKCMMITPKSVDKETLKAFVALHDAAWADDSSGNDQIINGLIVVTNGEIGNLIPLD